MVEEKSRSISLAVARSRYDSGLHFGGTSAVYSHVLDVDARIEVSVSPILGRYLGTCT
jgi:hypothetical protein